MLLEPRRRRPRHEVAAFMAALAHRAGERKALESWMFEVVSWCVRPNRNPNG